MLPFEVLVSCVISLCAMRCEDVCVFISTVVCHILIRFPSKKSGLYLSGGFFMHLCKEFFWLNLNPLLVFLISLDTLNSFSSLSFFSPIVFLEDII